MVISHPETLSQANPEMFILGTLYPVMLTYKLTTIPLLLGVLPSLRSVAYKLRCGFQSQLLRLLGTSVSIKIMKEASLTDCCVIQWGHIKDTVGLVHCRCSKERELFLYFPKFSGLGVILNARSIYFDIPDYSISTRYLAPLGYSCPN